MTTRQGVGVLTGLWLAASAAAVVVAGTSSPAVHELTARPTTTPLTHVELSCPSNPKPSPASSAMVAVAPGDGAKSSPADGRVRVTGLRAPRRTFGDQSGVGSPVEVPLSGPRSAGSDGGVVVAGAGTAARGLTAAEWSSYGGRSASGLAAALCRPPAASWWFAGVDTAVGATTRLVLVNPNPSTAVVDVDVFGPDGRIAVPGGRGIGVAASSERVVDLAGYAPGHSALTVHVAATTGRVVAAVHTTTVSALTATGAEWVPVAAAPSTTVLVGAGVVGSPQRLVVANPGDRQALVHVRFVSATGTFASTDVDDVSLPPGGVVSRAITGVTGGKPTAVLLQATRPVVAATVSKVVRPSRDFAVSVASAPLGPVAVVPLIPDTAMRLAFSAPGPDGTTVRIVVVDRHGSLVSHDRVNVGGRSTAGWQAPPRAAGYVLLRVSADGPVIASASYAGTSGMTALPVLSGPSTVTRPGVVAAPVG